MLIGKHLISKEAAQIFANLHIIKFEAGLILTKFNKFYDQGDALLADVYETVVVQVFQNTLGVVIGNLVEFNHEGKQMLIVRFELPDDCLERGHVAEDFCEQSEGNEIDINVFVFLDAEDDFLLDVDE